MMTNNTDIKREYYDFCNVCGNSLIDNNCSLVSATLCQKCEDMYQDVEGELMGKVK